MTVSRTFVALIGILAGFPAWAGTLVIPGTGDGQEMLRHVAAVFSTLHPQTTVIIPPSIGSVGGKLAVLEGRAVLARIAVPLTAAEEANGLRAVTVMRIPTAFFTHSATLVSNLSEDQIADIFAGAVKNWKQVGGPDARVKVIRREEIDSTTQVLRSTKHRWKDLRITPLSPVFKTTQDTLDAVRGIPGAVSYGPYSKNIEHEVRVISVDGVHPTNPQYATATVVRLVYKGEKPESSAAEFLNFVRSEAARQIFVLYGGIPESMAD